MRGEEKEEVGEEKKLLGDGEEGGVMEDKKLKCEGFMGRMMKGEKKVGGEELMGK